jgi:heme-degrading monooxygenase HmoA
VIRHVVSWRLNDGDEQAKARAYAEIAAALTVLPNSIPGILSFTVARNVAYPVKNFDVILVADFETLDGLEAYQVHPDHLAAAAVVGARVAARACVDFEV